MSYTSCITKVNKHTQDISNGNYIPTHANIGCKIKTDPGFYFHVLFSTGRLHFIEVTKSK